jgi:uncharacterized membrane protein YeaQ/YmgE (transglycosylase-associated protein family)
VIGLLGAILGGVIVQALKIRFPDLVTFEFTLGDVLVAFLGAVIFLLIVRLIQRRM